jgi:hypothetical protein
MHRIGFIYWQNGYKKEADYYFNEQIKICQESIKMGRSYSTGLATYYDLAGVYAFKGEKEKSYQNLQRMGFNTCSPPSWWIILFKEDPLFNSIRNEPEIQQIVSDVEAKYQAEHDRVKKWMEEQGMLKKGQ